jgi:hypothetical protein
VVSDYLPYFKFFPRDWLSSPTVMLMTLAEQGAYLRMLALQWESGAIDPRHLRGLLGMNEQEVEDLLAGTVGEAFQRNEEGHLYNPRLDLERRDAQSLIEKRREAGRARARKANLGPTTASAQQSSANTEAEAEAEYRAQKRKGKRRSAPEEMGFAITDWERLNGPMPSALRNAMEDYMSLRKEQRFPLWTREMWLRNLAGGFTPGELAAAFETATRSGWKSVHPKKKGGSAPKPGQINGNAFANLLEQPYEPE